MDVLGTANLAASVTANGDAAYRKGDYYHKAVSVNNSANPVYFNVNATATLSGYSPQSVTGDEFVPKTPENYGTGGSGYDADGNLLIDGRWIYTWDAENRLIRMVANTSFGPQQRLDFDYDWRGRRVSKKVWNDTAGTGPLVLHRKFVYDGWRMVAELDGENGNTFLHTYMWGLDLSGTFDGAGGVGGLLAVNDSVQGLHFAAYDGNGNIVALVKGSDGTVSATYEYGPFAELIRASGPMARSPIRFSTKYTDDESDLVYYGFRYYNSSTGRWLSRDPIQEDGGNNLYQFVYNNPSGYYDYLGREGYWSDVGATYGGMGQGAGNVAKELGYFAGDLLLGFVAVMVPDCCCDGLLTKLDDIGYKGSALTGSAGQDGGLKTSGKVFIAPIVAAVSVPVNAYESVEAALDGNLNAAGKRMGEGLATAGLLVAPFSKGPGGTGGYTGGGTLGEAVYNLSPSLFKTLPRQTQLAIRARAGARCEGPMLNDLGSGAVQNLQIHPRLPSGQLAEWWFVADGVCRRNGGFDIREFKASNAAPLSRGQTAGFPLLERFGGAVRGIKGADQGIPKGELLPPIRIRLIRQSQFQTSELFPSGLSNSE